MRIYIYLTSFCVSLLEDINCSFITLIIIIIILLLSFLVSELKCDICTLYMLFNLIILPQVPLVKFSSDNISIDAKWTLTLIIIHVFLSLFAFMWLALKNLIFIIILASWKVGMAHLSIKLGWPNLIYCIFWYCLVTSYWNKLVLHSIS